MKNWLIEKLGGVSKKDYEEVIQAANSLKGMADDYSQRISDGLKEKAEMRAEKAEMEKAAEMVSANLSETISRLNEEKRTSNGLMAKGTALGIKVSELQDELERKDKELADTKVKLLDVLRNKPSDPALRSEIARLKGELELLKRNKFKRGRK
ncbi:hypothetical protein HMPREF3052_00035 [Neisseria sp. HMSC056A03]|uniref:hypothetical protein n=1 Tax=Neisseria sp. HMSC056A03 TaxID=1739544 RepID=UPI0008A4E4C2|nr:hypothetical protein [Neisseria sp. HMSC056A03]OFO30308.1 hypothetical protein HMPREF3052_00035 [Neisseria sp. HMSC056A03]